VWWSHLSFLQQINPIFHHNVAKGKYYITASCGHFSRTIDDAKIFEQTPGGPVPFLLLDGHHSHLEVPFLDYIFNDHKWFVCIGVPYAMHYWHRGWLMTDIIPLINFA
jgi:hypothetical protein